MVVQRHEDDLRAARIDLADAEDLKGVFFPFSRKLRSW
jgi:hypothetical protein